MDPRRPINILFVCTANVCRSPLAAGLMALHANATGAAVQVASASVAAEQRPTDPTVIRILADRGVRGERMVSRPVDAALVAGADVVLTMTLDHAAEITERFPDHAHKTFALAHLADVVSMPGAGVSTDEWLATVYATPRSGLVDDGWDIDDPVGMPARVFYEAEARLDNLTNWLATVLADVTAPPAGATQIS